MRKNLKAPFQQKAIMFYEHRKNIHKIEQLKGLARLYSDKALRNGKDTVGGSKDN